MEEERAENHERAVNVKKEKKVVPQRKIISVAVVATFVVSILVCFLFYKYLYADSNKKKPSNVFRPVIIDINGIITEKKDEFLEKYKDIKNPSKEEVAKMQKETIDFVEKLNWIIAEESKDKILLEKTAVVSPVEDITDSVKEQLGMKSANKQLNITPKEDKKKEKGKE